MNERPASESAPTLFLPRGLAAGDSRPGWSLSPELRKQIARRLYAIALVYSAAFFCASVVPNVLLGRFAHWVHDPSFLPSMSSILLGLLIAGVAASRRLAWRTKLDIGLLFEVLGSYGIALAQYLEVPDLARQPDVLMVLSPSWVGIWMAFYSVVVPARPAKSLVALLAAGSAPPVVLWLSLRSAHLLHLIPPGMFLVHHVLPYAICVGMAWFGARVVYRLGREVSRAQDLGSYRLIERLGRGGMGEVWRATHRLLARPAAIKFIHPEAIANVGPDEARMVLKRFEREARSTASLTSEHTVDLYDFGIAEDGTFYYVMELLEGLDCDELVRRFGALPPARVIHLLAQICESLDEAHGKGLVHRDVKPANVYVCRTGNRFDFVKVLDFGLVTHRRAPETQNTHLTQPHQAIGTPQFMPPEVARGKEIDGRADLYAVGCVAYWMATGRPVFTGETLYEVISKHLHATPEPPRALAPHGLPAALNALILACLEKDPDHRPQTARELARRLREVPLEKPWGDEQAERWWCEAGLVRAEAPAATADARA